MVGIIGYASIEKNILFSLLNLDNHFSWLILAGFLINAGAPPFAAWVADAYPEASFSGTVFLSAFTTKTQFTHLLEDLLVQKYHLLRLSDDILWNYLCPIRK